MMSIASFHCAGIIAIVVATMGNVSAVRAVEVSLEDELRNGLMAALGDSFQFVSGEFGQSNTPISPAWGDRTSFWFAKVQPKAAGNYIVSYTTDAPPLPEGVKDRGRPKNITYRFPFTIGERGTPRALLPDGYYGPAQPIVNVGDALIVPVYVSIKPSSFARVDPRETWYFPSDKEYFRHDVVMKSATKKAEVRLDVSIDDEDSLTTLAVSASSSVNRPGDETHHGISAYLEFVKPRQFHLVGQIDRVDDALGSDQAMVRVVEGDRAISVMLQQFRYGTHDGIFKTGGSECIDGGTMEARAGDRIILSCGEYRTQGIDFPEKYRAGVVSVRAFKDIPAYRTTSKE